MTIIILQSNCVEVMFLKKLRDSYGQEILAFINLKTSCIPVCHLKIWRLQYTKLLISLFHRAF